MPGLREPTPAEQKMSQPFLIAMHRFQQEDPRTGKFLENLWNKYAISGMLEAGEAMGRALDIFEASRQQRETMRREGMLSPLHYPKDSDLWEEAKQKAFPDLDKQVRDDVAQWSQDVVRDINRREALSWIALSGAMSAASWLFGRNMTKAREHVRRMENKLENLPPANNQAREKKRLEMKIEANKQNADFSQSAALLTGAGVGTVFYHGVKQFIFSQPQKACDQVIINASRFFVTNLAMENERTESVGMETRT